MTSLVTTKTGLITGPERNGPNNRIGSDCAGRA